MITFLTTTTAITLTEAFGAGSMLGLAVYGAVRHKKIHKIKIK